MRFPWSRPADPPPAPVAEAPETPHLLSTHARVTPRLAEATRNAVVERINRAAPVPYRTPGSPTVAMDDSNDGKFPKARFGPGWSAVNDVMATWYGSQTFIGFQMCAIIAQHWLVDKACSIPARDAVRKGFRIMLEGAMANPEMDTAIKKANKRMKVNHQLRDFVRMGRVFGIRIAIFKVETGDDKAFYENPFNADAVTPGSYKGIVQVDPYWCSPELDEAAVSDPASPNFYEPTWWNILGVRYHRSHLRIFVPSPVPDLLKPTYQYGGVSVPQKIMERVYAAERSANEAPQLLMTKRLTVWGTDLEEVAANQEKVMAHLANFVDYRDNYGVKINEKDDVMQVFDTTLSGVAETIEGQYSVVAAIANVPVTKLMATAPKGMDATGEYDEASYHEELETIQENDLMPFMDRHNELLILSEIEPQFGLARGSLHATTEFEALDSPTAAEQADTNKTKAETDQILVSTGAIDGLDVRKRLQTERDTGYGGLVDEVVTGDPLDDAILALGGEVPGGDPLADATAALGAPTAPPTPGGDPLTAALAALG